MNLNGDHKTLRDAIISLDTLRDNKEYSKLMDKQIEAEDKLYEVLEHIKGGKELLEKLFIEQSDVMDFSEKYFFNLGFKSHDFMGEIETTGV